ncbi:MAG: DNA polymerase III subunit gamma/tau [Bdellovibrionales bacterium]
MAYQVIARKFRPQIFGEVVGQNHVTQTLQNALKNQRLPHALLFTGPRGTGKTSSARILAKALRCYQPQDFIPCGVCESCVEITEGRAVDVIEIDGASNNGVDAIRELRDGVSYRPSKGTTKVYIIDEVHMLSTSAFNALLKTLEEPPGHVVFILATTEVHKIPQTILSRCQRFDFRRIPTRQITEQIKAICDREKVSYEPEALWVIARQGDGSMRDSLTLLDQVISFANGPLTATKVSEILGLTDRTLLLETLKALLNSDSAGVIEILKKLNFSGIYPELFARELVESIRTLTLVKVAGSQLEMIDRPDSEITILVDLATQTSEDHLHFLFDMALRTAQDVAKAADPQIVLDMGLLRMAQAPRLVDLQKLLSNGAAGPLEVSAGPSTPHLNHGALATKAAPPASGAKAAPAGPRYLKASSAPEKWLLFVNEIRAKDPIFTAKIENLLFVAEDGKILKLAVPAKLMFLVDAFKEPETRTKLQSFLDQNWGEGYSFQVALSQKVEGGESAKKLAEKKTAAQEKQVDDQVRNHPSVQAAQKVFKGEIKSVPVGDRNKR